MPKSKLAVFLTICSLRVCETLLQHLKKWLEHAIVTQKAMGQKTMGQEQLLPLAGGGSLAGRVASRVAGQEQLKVAAAIVDLFHRIPAASARFIELLCKLVLTTEKALAVEPGSLLRDPLRRYLSRFPSETLDIFLQELYAKDSQWSRYVEYLLKHPEGEMFRNALQEGL